MDCQNESGKKRRRFKIAGISKLYTTNTGRWFLAILICAVCVACVVCTRPVFFSLHDTNMMKTYSGYRTGIPTPEHAYGSMFCGYLMYALYSITMRVPWYTICTCGLLFFSLVTICRCMLTVGYRKNCRVIWPVLLYVLLFAAAFYYQVGTLLYTVNAAIVCCAAISLLLPMHYETDRRVKIADFILSLLLLMVGMAIRNSAYTSCICFWLLVVAMQTADHIVNSARNEGSVKQAFKAQKKRMIGTLVLICLLPALGQGGTALNHALHEATWPDGFQELNTYRAKFMDYNTVEYDEAAEFYQQLGWSESFYELVKTGNYFMDEKYNTDNLKAIYEYALEQGTVKNGVADMLRLGWETGFQTNIGKASSFGLAACVFLLLLCLALRPGKSVMVPLLCGLFSAGGCVLMCAYLCWTGRFPERAYQCVALPAMTVMLFCALSMLGRKQEPVCAGHAAARVCAVICLLAAVGLGGVSIRYAMAEAYDWELLDRYANHNMKYSSMVQYAMEWPEDIFIHDITVSGDYRLIIDSSKENAQNLILWGGTNLYTESYYRQLEALGREQLQTEDLFDDNVYYLTGSGEEYLGMLRSYLEEQYGPVSLTPVDYVEGNVYVYKISLE